MGFATIGASVIMFTTMLLVGSVVANGALEAQREQDEARMEEADRIEFARHTDVTMRDGTYNFVLLNLAGSWHLNLTNDGSTNLDVTKVHVFIDSAWVNDNIATTQVDGDSGNNVWAPEQVLYIRGTAVGLLGLGNSPQPERITVVVETGESAVWVNTAV